MSGGSPPSIKQQLGEDNLLTYIKLTKEKRKKKPLVFFVHFHFVNHFFTNYGCFFMGTAIQVPILKYKDSNPPSINEQLTWCGLSPYKIWLS